MTEEPKPEEVFNPNGSVFNRLEPRDHCHICGSWTQGWCDRCKRPFCLKHKIPDNYLVCIACMTEEEAGIHLEPEIKDANGVSHKGKHVSISGEYWIRNNRPVAEMTDEELKLDIIGLKDAVRGIEIAREHLKIRLNHRENELEARTQRHRRATLTEASEALRRDQIARGAEAKQTGGAKVDQGLINLFKLLKARGLDKEGIAKFLQQMGKK